MRGLVPLLGVELLLLVFFSTGFVRSMDLNEVYRKLCGRYYLRKAVFVCEKVRGRAAHTRGYDDSLASSAEDRLNEAYRRPPGQLLVNGQLHQRAPYRRARLPLGLEQHEAMPGDAGGPAPRTIRGSVQQQPYPTGGSRRRGRAGRHAIRKQCCQTKCTAREISYACRRP